MPRARAAAPPRCGRIFAGQVTAGVADLLVVGIPTWGVATVHGRRTIDGDEPMEILGDPITPVQAARRDQLDQLFGGGGGDGGAGGGGDGGGGGGG